MSATTCRDNSRMLLSGRFWARMAAINAIAAMLAVIAFSGIRWNTPISRVLASMGVSFLFSTSISPFCVYAMARLSPVVTRRYRFPLNWTILVAVLTAIAVAGTALATTVLLALGYVTPAGFGSWFMEGLRTALVITLTFGIFATAYERLKDRLAEATLALRTTERDQAEARRLAAEAQLAALENRVEPHFLFNTLNSIAALVHQDPAGAERMTLRLASLLRASLDQQTPLVPLTEELRHVRDYLDIERVRFGDRLRYDIDVEAAAAEALVPRLSVQTLVENSVKYAVAPRRAGGSITVRAASSNGHLRVAVVDDGPGFDAAAVRTGHGLALVRDRLAMVFGGAAGLTIDGRPGETAVTLDVPRSA
jgi:two-component system, LytTR family, sensor histidine kinase AlgZ